MFWGVTLEKGKRYTQTVDNNFHISMAALEIKPDASGNARKKPVSVMVEHNGSEFMLCTLNPSTCVQQPLDLNFAEGEEVTLFLDGEGVVHLTGYLLDDDDSFDPDFDAEQEEEEGEVDDEEQEDNDVETAIQLASSAKRHLQEAPLPKSKKLKINKSLVEVEERKENYDESDGEEAAEDDDESDDEEAEDDDEESTSEDGGETEDSQVVTFKNQLSHGKTINPVNQTPQPKIHMKFAKSPQNKVVQQKAPQKIVEQQKISLKEQKLKKPQVSLNGSRESAGESQSARKRKKKRKIQQLEETTPSVTPAKPQPNMPQKLPSKIIFGGTEIQDITVGSGPVARNGNSVQLKYIGRLKNNKVFDQSRNNDLLRFRLGKREVIPGMEKGVEGMKVGGKRRLIIPSSQGYGKQATGPIPPNSTLIFDVELKSVS